MQPQPHLIQISLKSIHTIIQKLQYVKQKYINLFKSEKHCSNVLFHDDDDDVNYARELTA